MRVTDPAAPALAIMNEVTRAKTSAHTNTFPTSPHIPGKERGMTGQEWRYLMGVAGNSWPGAQTITDSSKATTDSNGDYQW